MKLIRSITCLSVFCLSLVAVSVSAADTKTCDSKKACCSEESACSAGSCPVSAAMASLPKMTYLIGEKSTCCSESAAAMAKAADAPIQYVVGEENFATQSDAMKTLVSKTEAMVAKFTTPSTCKASGTTTLAGHASTCPVDAGQTAKKVNSAVALVSMKYKVGEEICSCPISAKAMAKKAGTTPVFVVDGVETHCEMSARLALARAKYKAAFQAVAAITPVVGATS